MTKEEKLQAFIEQLSRDSNTLAVIVFGSYARGDSRPDSDIDLVVILKKGYKRIAEFVDGQAFEIIYTTEADGIKYWESHKHDGVGLWKVARVLYDRDGTGERLKEFGAKLCQEIPPEVDSSTLAHLRYDFEDLMRAIEASKASDPARASLLLHKKAANLIGVFFDLRREWHPAAKKQLAEIDSRDANLGQMLKSFYLAHDVDQQIETLASIGKYILN